MIAAAYLDSSALLRLFFEASDSEIVALAVRDAAALFSSRMALTEVRVALSRARRDARLSPEDYRVTLDALDDFWEAEIQPLEVTEPVIQSAEHVAERVSLRTSDALHLGHARLLRKELAPNASLAVIACDQRLLQAAATLGFATPIPPRP